MANIFISSIPFEDAIGRLECSPLWTVEKIDDDPTYCANYKDGGACRVYREGSMLAIANNPDFRTVLELQVTIGSRVLIDVGSLAHDDKMPWWRCYDCREVDYAAELTKAVDRWECEILPRASGLDGEDHTRSPKVETGEDDPFLEELQGMGEEDFVCQVTAEVSAINLGLLPSVAASLSGLLQSVKSPQEGWSEEKSDLAIKGTLTVEGIGGVLEAARRVVHAARISGGEDCVVKLTVRAPNELIAFFEFEQGASLEDPSSDPLLPVTVEIGQLEARDGEPVERAISGILTDCKVIPDAWKTADCVLAFRGDMYLGADIEVIWEKAEQIALAVWSISGRYCAVDVLVTLGVSHLLFQFTQESYARLIA